MKNIKTGKETVLALLRAIIDYECSKPYWEIDGEFVSKCVDSICEIEGIRILTQKEVNERVKKIFAKCNEVQNNSFTDSEQTLNLKAV